VALNNILFIIKPSNAMALDRGQVMTSGISQTGLLRHDLAVYGGTAFLCPVMLVGLPTMPVIVPGHGSADVHPMLSTLFSRVYSLFVMLPPCSGDVTNR
jgi:hypothetical protein